MYLYRKLKHSAWTEPKEQFLKLFQLEDTPHSIALGGAIGMFVSITPTFGFQMLSVLLIAAVCRPFFKFNIIAGIVGVYFSNPVTGPFLNYASYKIGLLFVGGEISYDELTKLLSESASFREFLKNTWEVFTRVGYPLTIGSLILGTIVGLVTYPIAYRLVSSAQLAANRLRELKAKREKRAAAAELADIESLQPAVPHLLPPTVNANKVQA
ncbi:DUF2062 domain-containing protein [Lacunimicrobium album]